MVLGIAGLTACGSAQPVVSAPVPSAEPVQPSPPVAASAHGAASPAIADGRHQCSLVAVVAEPRQVSIQSHEFLTGDAANRAAREAGEVGPDEDAPDDYYIRKTKGDPVTLPVAAGVVVQLLPRVPPNYLEMTSTSVAPSDFETLLKYCASRGGDCGSPFEVTVRGGRVVEISEVYVP